MSTVDHLNQAIRKNSWRSYLLDTAENLFFKVGDNIAK